MFWRTKTKREAAAEREREHEEFLKRLREVLEIPSEYLDPPTVGVRSTRTPMASIACSASFE
jgi:hypothetical protein